LRIKEQKISLTLQEHDNDDYDDDGDGELKKVAAHFLSIN